MTACRTSHEDLSVWQNAMDLTVEVYELTGHFPRHELYGLTSQMRRCASSIAANIAEGRARSSDADFRRFLYLAAGSVAELETFLELSRRLHYASEEKLERMRAATREVGRMLYGLIRAITRSIES